MIDNLKKEMMYNPLDDNLFEEKRYRAVLEKKHNKNIEDNIYRIHKIDRSSLKDILFIRSALPFLYGLSTRIKKRELLDSYNFKSMQKFQTVLGKLVLFLFHKNIDSYHIDNCHEEELDRYDESTHEKPLKDRQRLLMDFGIIDI